MRYTFLLLTCVLAGLGALLTACGPDVTPPLTEQPSAPTVVEATSAPSSTSTSAPPLSATPAPAATMTDTPVSVTATPTALYPTIEVTADILNVRQGPSTDTEVIGRLQLGATLPAIGRNVDGDWLQVTLNDGSLAWVSAEWVKLSTRIQALPVVQVTPAPTAVAQASVTGTVIATETPTPTVETPTVTPTAEMTGEPTATATATKAPTPMPAPQLVTPLDGANLAKAELRELSWTWAGALASDTYFVVRIAYPHDGATWQDVQWVKEPRLTTPPYLSDLVTGDRRLEWNVVVMRHTGTDADGLMTGEPISLPSATRSFIWRPD